MEAATSRSFFLPQSLLVSAAPRSEFPRYAAPSTSPLSFFSSATLRNLISSSKNLKISPICCSPTDLQEAKKSPDLAILLEVEGVLADVYRFCNRQAFNVAFQKLGLDCANWTETVYSDLTKNAGGDEQRMMILFFNRVGWPTSLPTNEKETFMRNILREKMWVWYVKERKEVHLTVPNYTGPVDQDCVQRKALDELVMTSSLPLRPGAQNFIDDALKEGIPVVMLTTYSKNGEKLSRSIIGKLGQDRTSSVTVLGKDEVEGSLYGQLVLGKGVSSSLDEQLAKEAQEAVSAEKQRIAEEVASVLKLSVEIDTSSSERIEKIITTLRAGAEFAGLPVQNCVLIAGSHSGVLGAEHIGMPCVVVRSSLTARAEFPSAKAVMDGFGGADLTISKLRQKIWS